MKRISLLIIMALVATSVALAQATNVPPLQGTDELGAHNGYGRGCVMCHTPHSGALGNGITPGSNSQNGMYALWGQDLTPLYGQTFNFSGDGAAKYPVTLPAVGTITSAHDANTIILFCLSCHDGVLTKVGMMKGQTVENLPIVAGGTGTAPTLLAKAAPGIGGYYSNDHPVGGSAYVSCNLPSTAAKGSAAATSDEVGYNWDCTGGGNTNTAISPGPNMKIFLTQNYTSSFWNKGNPLASFGGTTVNAVTCTTCHNQHSMTSYVDASGNAWKTMFFVNGYYNPSSAGNNVAQFCRNCHGGNSNEMVGVMNVPTT